METLYLKGLYERSTLPSGNVEHKYYVGNTVVIDSTDAKQSKTLYTHKEHLGSTVTVTDANGSVIQHINYDAWGKQNRFYTSRSLVSLLNQQSPVESKGYTGHKEISDLGIIHMNGRIYDPTLGRFLQADPHIQAPMNSQNYNRYSYVLNNPMSYTDPSGYFFKSLKKFVKKYWKTIVQIGITVMTAGAGLAWAIAGGALSGYVATGSLKGALVGAFSGALFYGAGELIANNGIQNILGKGLIRGMAGGISSVLSGGKFGHGFAAAGVSSMAGGKIYAAFKDTGARVVAAVVGGTVIQVTGGKFANGALTAAFMKAYNDANHPKFESPDAPLAKWFRSIADGAAQLRSSIEGVMSDIGNGISNTMSSLAEDPARTAVNTVVIAGAGTCAFTAGAGCALAATAATVGASDMLEQTTGYDPVQRGTEKAFMGAGMDAETARQAAAIGVNVPGALTGAGATTNMFRALSVNQTISASSAANAYLSA
ncbi:RHS repeat-associated core domain-containing protein [uncultured Pseudoalteromonas sp.]|nr:RHS repeat-associated core domain-containing protein [uncultured Pseudoalteromonas sp.]